MDNIQKALTLLNQLVVAGTDNCTKIAFISQLLSDTLKEMEAEDGKK